MAQPELTTLQTHLALEDKEARRFITKFDREFPYRIEDEEKIVGTKAVVRALNTLYGYWEDNEGRRPEGWEHTVRRVFQRQKVLSS